MAAPTNVEAGTDQEEGRVNQVFDRVNTTAATWLGTTLECAQCHNHKYDPFTQKEYYQLFAFFNQTAIRGGATGATVPTLRNCRFHSISGLPQWIDDGSRTEAAQWTGARSASPLSPTAIFDATSRQDITAAPRDPKALDYSATI